MPERLRLLHPMAPGERTLDERGRDADAVWSVDGRRLSHGAVLQVYVEAEDAWLTGTFALPRTLDECPKLLTSVGTFELDPTDPGIRLRWPEAAA